MRRSAALRRALAKLGHPKWKNVFRGDFDDWKRLLASRHPLAIHWLVSTLGKTDEKLLRTAAEGWRQIGIANALRPLCDALANGNDSMRRAAAEVLSRFADGRAAEPLMTALADTDAGVRRSAALGLGRLGQGTP